MAFFSNCNNSKFFTDKLHQSIDKCDSVKSLLPFIEGILQDRAVSIIKSVIFHELGMYKLHPIQNILIALALVSANYQYFF